MRRLAPIAVVLAAALIVLGLYSRGLTARADSCVTKGIATAAGREGVCTRYFGHIGPFATHEVTYVVADAGHRLRLPGYTVRLLDTHERAYRAGGLAAADPTDYPDGVGTLVSVRLAVTNRDSHPMWFVPLRTNVLLDRPGTTGSELVSARYQAWGHGQRIVPAGTVEVAPGQTRTGWVAYVAPQWAPEVLHVRSADLQFMQRPGYVGQIRLWKYAGRAGRAALGLGRAAGAQL